MFCFVALHAYMHTYIHIYTHTYIHLPTYLPQIIEVRGACIMFDFGALGGNIVGCIFINDKFTVGNIEAAIGR